MTMTIKGGTVEELFWTLFRVVYGMISNSTLLIYGSFDCACIPDKRCAFMALRTVTLSLLTFL
jgi:hypothetical protein